MVETGEIDRERHTKHYRDGGSLRDDRDTRQREAEIRMERDTETKNIDT